MENSIVEILSIVGAFGASLVFDTLKKHTTALDTRIGRAIRPVTPALIGAASIGLPYLTDALGISPVDPSVFVAAPTATVAAVTLHEVVKRIPKKLR